MRLKTDVRRPLAIKHFQVLQAREGEGGPRWSRCAPPMSGVVRGPVAVGEKRNRQETLELALRKSRLVVETDLAGRKKRDGKCAGRVQQVPGICSRGRKKNGDPECLRRVRCGPRIPAVEDGGDEVAVPSLFLFPSLSPSSPFFLPFFLYIRLAQINRANEWSSA